MTIKLSDAFVKQFEKNVAKAYKDYFDYTQTYAYKRLLVIQRIAERLERKLNNG